MRREPASIPLHPLTSPYLPLRYGESLRTFGLLLGATLAFDLGIFVLKGRAEAFDFITAYLIEDSLSIDNLFVFLLIFRTFKV